MIYRTKYSFRTSLSFAYSKLSATFKVFPVSLYCLPLPHSNLIPHTTRTPANHFISVAYKKFHNHDHEIMLNVVLCLIFVFPPSS